MIDSSVAREEFLFEKEKKKTTDGHGKDEKKTKETKKKRREDQSNDIAFGRVRQFLRRSSLSFFFFPSICSSFFCRIFPLFTGRLLFTGSN